MRTRIKICGITRAEDAAAAIAAGADAIGFVFWPGSPRVVTAAAAAGIAREAPVVARVGVFVNAEPREVVAAVRIAGLSAVQLHGDEDVEAYAGCGAPLIKAIAVSSEADVERALALPAGVTVLVDAADDERRGGTGRRAHWALAARIAAARPVMLAGGLNADNVGVAIAKVHPWAVDVSSGVETRPGVKDARAIAAVCRAVAESDRGEL